MIPSTPSTLQPDGWELNIVAELDLDNWVNVHLLLENHIIVVCPRPLRFNKPVPSSISSCLVRFEDEEDDVGAADWETTCMRDLFTLPLPALLRAKNCSVAPRTIMQRNVPSLRKEIDVELLTGALTSTFKATNLKPPLRKGRRTQEDYALGGR